ncbi:hypothetical protein [Cyclobacterium plantarum]|uniref:Uncharacterized protein n=1 Tax=Cyclobacterium plantarum TaxID=2716263 RepID=A0ABX0H0P3_9BACT|nr:hypothetical protein [Cyclobacterium plantarum]NHE55326.1 hypothetical protein [Cyclobacterium plantarum]
MHKQLAAFFPALILLSGLFSSTWAQSNPDQIIFKTGWVTTYGVSVKYPRYARN